MVLDLVEQAKNLPVASLMTMGRLAYLFESMVLLHIVRLLVGMTGFQDGGYTQLAQLERDYLRWVKISFTHQ